MPLLLLLPFLGGQSAMSLFVTTGEPVMLTGGTYIIQSWRRRKKLAAKQMHDTWFGSDCPCLVEDACVVIPFSPVSKLVEDFSYTEK